MMRIAALGALACGLMAAVWSVASAQSLGAGGLYGLVETPGSAVNSSGLATSDLTMAPGTEISVTSADNDAVTPSFACEPGTGWYCSADGIINSSHNGTTRWEIISTRIRGGTGGGALINGTSQLSTPGVLGHFNDPNTGLYGDGSDMQGVGAGGVRMFEGTVAGGVTTVMYTNFPQSDVGATCTLGQIAYDTGGVADEICFCQATNTWMCATVAAGPVD